MRLPRPPYRRNSWPNTSAAWLCGAKSWAVKSAQRGEIGGAPVSGCIAVINASQRYRRSRPRPRPPRRRLRPSGTNLRPVHRRLRHARSQRTQRPCSTNSGALMVYMSGCATGTTAIHPVGLMPTSITNGRYGGMGRHCYFWKRTAALGRFRPLGDVAAYGRSGWFCDGSAFGPGGRIAVILLGMRAASLFPINNAPRGGAGGYGWRAWCAAGRYGYLRPIRV
jgi:hypothetical protein